MDSRRSDYFDSVKHHYSEDHDFITVDCGGTRLTVWLPGEAKRFRAGDSVTVTYNGVMTRSIPPQITATSIRRISC